MSSAFTHQVLPGTMQQEDSATRSSLWMGDLEPWMDEAYLRQLWFSLGHNVSVKVVRSKITGQPAGYCFLDFATPMGAQHAMENINGQLIASTNTYFRLNWSSGGYTTGMRFDPGPEFSLFVGNLGREVNDYLLFTTFYPRYPNCKSAKVVTDPQTGNSKGFGFVRFGDETECHRALYEMNGHFCGLNAMRLDLATPRTRTAGGLSGGYGIQQELMALQSSHFATSPQSQQAFDQNYDPSSDPFNTKVFVGGLAGHVTEDELRIHFALYGEIVYVKIPPGKGCGFVHYATRSQAEAAISNLNGTLLGGYPIRLTWARSAGSDKQQRVPTGYSPPSSYVNNLLDSAFSLSSSTTPLSLPGLPNISLGGLSMSAMDTPPRDPLGSWDTKLDNAIRPRHDSFDRFDDSVWRFTSNSPILRSDRMSSPLQS